MTFGINTYLFASESLPSLWVIHYKDNLIPKAAFWPFVLLCMVIITGVNLSLKPTHNAGASLEGIGAAESGN